MREAGIVTCAMVKALNATRTAIAITDTLRWERLTERESTPGSTERCMMESGTWA